MRDNRIAFGSIAGVTNVIDIMGQGRFVSPLIITRGGDELCLL